MLFRSLRIRLKKLDSPDYVPSSSDVKTDLYLLARAVNHLMNTSLPEELSFLSNNNVSEIIPFDYSELGAEFKKMRINAVSFDNEFIHALYDDKADSQEIKVSIPKDFDIEMLREGAQLNLIDVNRVNDVFVPRFIVFEPDFLLDISAIAECFRDYGNNPLNYFMSRLSTDAGSHHILLGNIANQFLDDIVNQTEDQPADYMTSMKKVFRNSPIAIASCEELNERTFLEEFFKNAKIQFSNIYNVVTQQFPAAKIDVSKALIEPSFICETLG